MDTLKEELEIVFRHFPDLNSIQKKQIIQLQELYFYWNERINLISRKDIQHLYMHHVLHSLSIAKVIQFIPGSDILDIGTGGGFPGIPLAILFPETKFYLNDSIHKKIKVVEEIKKALQLNNVITIHGRAEKIKQKFDFVVSRAVTNFPDFVQLCQNKIGSNHRHSLPNGILYLKGGELNDLKTEMGKYFTDALIFNIFDYFPYPYFETKRIIHWAVIR
ncbi:MAG: 16S rRNA (guanine(527)-N(7))-methyltransferase RsmG [Bacteroidia bacterium]|nr:16S rRNA (guanine(527)-N(7))-methyltransferase RsmG [Bacteroidia bacterium]